MYREWQEENAKKISQKQVGGIPEGEISLCLMLFRINKEKHFSSREIFTDRRQICLDSC